MNGVFLVVFSGSHRLARRSGALGDPEGGQAHDGGIAGEQARRLKTIPRTGSSCTVLHCPGVDTCDDDIQFILEHSAISTLPSAKKTGEKTHVSAGCVCQDVLLRD